MWLAARPTCKLHALFEAERQWYAVVNGGSGARLVQTVHYQLQPDLHASQRISVCRTTRFGQARITCHVKLRRRFDMPASLEAASIKSVFRLRKWQALLTQTF